MIGSPDKIQRRNFKAIVLGAQKAGKTNLIARYVKNEYNHHETHTFDMHVESKNEKYDNKFFAIQIWDCAGDRFEFMLKSLYQQAEIAIYVFDATDRQSFADLEKWIKLSAKYGPKNLRSILCGNKIDATPRRVSENEGNAFAEQYGMTYFDISVKEDYNVDVIFVEACRLVYEKDQVRLQKSASKRK